MSLLLKLIPWVLMALGIIVTIIIFRYLKAKQHTEDEEACAAAIKDRSSTLLAGIQQRIAAIGTNGSAPVPAPVPVATKPVAPKPIGSVPPKK